MSSVTIGTRITGPEAWPPRSPDLQLGQLRKSPTKSPRHNSSPSNHFSTSNHNSVSPPNLVSTSPKHNSTSPNHIPKSSPSRYDKSPNHIVKSPNHVIKSPSHTPIFSSCNPTSPGFKSPKKGPSPASTPAYPSPAYPSPAYPSPACPPFKDNVLIAGDVQGPPHSRPTSPLLIVSYIPYPSACTTEETSPPYSTVGVDTGSQHLEEAENCKETRESKRNNNNVLDSNNKNYCHNTADKKDEEKGNTPDAHLKTRGISDVSKNQQVCDNVTNGDVDKKKPCTNDAISSNGVSITISSKAISVSGNSTNSVDKSKSSGHNILVPSTSSDNCGTSSSINRSGSGVRNATGGNITTAGGGGGAGNATGSNGGSGGGSGSSSGGGGSGSALPSDGIYGGASQGSGYDPFSFEGRPLTHPQAPTSTTNIPTRRGSGSAATGDGGRSSPTVSAPPRQRRRCLLLCCCCRCTWLVVAGG